MRPYLKHLLCKNFHKKTEYKVIIIMCFTLDSHPCPLNTNGRLWAWVWTWVSVIENFCLEFCYLYMRPPDVGAWPSPSPGLLGGSSRDLSSERRVRNNVRPSRKHSISTSSSCTYHTFCKYSSESRMNWTILSLKASSMILPTFEGIHVTKSS